jgi:hypothetical protein
MNVVGGQRDKRRSFFAPARGRWSRWLLISITAICVAVVLALVSVTALIGWWSSSSSTRHLADQFDELELGPEFKLAASEGWGSSECLFGDCPQLERYYISALSVREACVDARSALADWGDIRADVGGQPQGVGETCAFAGTRDGYEVVAQVRVDMAVESPSIIGERRITAPHNSVLFIHLFDPVS